MRLSTPRSITAGARRLGLGGGMAAAVLAGALLLGACGSSTPSSSGSTTPTTASGGSTTPTTTASGGSTTPTTAASGGGGISALAQDLQKGETGSYLVTYAVTGVSSVMGNLTYATAPPSSFAFEATTSSGKTDVVSSGTVVDACTEKTGASIYTCIGVPDADATAYTEAFQLFTGKYWYTTMTALEADATASGFKTSTSSKTLAGQSLSCITWSGGPSDSPGGEVCVTSGGILGYAHSDAGNTTLSLVSFSTSPPASTFQPPAGATTETMPAGA